MTGGTFILPPPSSSDEDESDRDWSVTDGEEDDNDLSTEEEQAIHVGPSAYSSRDEIAMTELGEAPVATGNGIGIRRRKRGRAGARERRVEWVGKPHVVGPEWMKMPLYVLRVFFLRFLISRNSRRLHLECWMCVLICHGCLCAARLTIGMLGLQVCSRSIQDVLSG